MHPAVALIVLLAACGQEPRITGEVQSIFHAEALAGALVRIDGQPYRSVTDDYGRFDLPRKVSGKITIRAGKKGYLQDVKEIEIGPEAKLNEAVFKLYPRPDAPGFYVVQSDSYDKVTSVRVDAIGDALTSVYGLKSAGTVRVSSEDLEVLFATDFRMNELKALGLELHRMSFTESMPFAGPLGPTEVPVNLYTSAGAVDIDIKPTFSRGAYLIHPKQPLEPGIYAFHYQDLLDPRDRTTWQMFPEALRIAFPFEVK